MSAINSGLKFYCDISPNDHFINDSADSLKGIFSKLVFSQTLSKKSPLQLLSTFLEMYEKLVLI